MSKPQPHLVGVIYQSLGIVGLSVGSVALLVGIITSERLIVIGGLGSLGSGLTLVWMAAVIQLLERIGGGSGEKPPVVIRLNPRAGQRDE